MFIKGFRFQVIFRVLLFCTSVFAFFYLLMQSKLYATIIITGFFILYQVYSLIRFVEKTNRYLTRFLLAVKHGDFTSSFSGKELGASFSQLIDMLNAVMEKMQRTRSEKEEHYRYMQTILHHVGIGLIAYGMDGEVDLINLAAKRLLKVARLQNINSLENFSPQLMETLLSIQAGEKALVKINEGEMELAVHAAEFRLREQRFMLVSIQNIQSELQEKEMEAWQNLVRVLTHEIMNSMTPITSMTETVIDLLKPLDDNEHLDSQAVLDAEAMTDLTGALKTIHKRSQGLTHFVSAYRNLTLIPKPQFRLFPVEELFLRVENLMKNKFNAFGIQFSWSVEPQTLELMSDPGLIEQVLINLLLNAVDTLMDCKNQHVELTASQDEIGRVLICVTDNGPGIVKEALGKVFIPFFTTKKKGSGIGLSLSRQIMKLHKGSIRVHSVPDEQTVFTLKF
jgi:nitrogen fixation/metabolism regulation signal transduction histidine kinase